MAEPPHLPAPKRMLNADVPIQCMQLTFVSSNYAKTVFSLQQRGARLYVNGPLNGVMWYWHFAEHQTRILPFFEMWDVR